MQEYDFSCYIIKYDVESIRGLVYTKDVFKGQDGFKVPLLLDHNHNDIYSVLGHAVLENRDDGVYAYCTLLDDFRLRDEILSLIKNKGSVALSPYSNKVRILNERYITSGVICEISLVMERMDPDEAYYPVMNKIDI